MIKPKRYFRFVRFMDYKFFREIVVKPCDPIMITKEVTEQIPNGKTDENGYNLYDTHTEVKEVESDYAKGVVECVPEYKAQDGTMQPIFPAEPGDIILYPTKAAKKFELDEDIRLISPNNIIAVVNK